MWNRRHRAGTIGNLGHGGWCAGVGPTSSTVPVPKEGREGQQSVLCPPSIQVVSAAFCAHLCLGSLKPSFLPLHKPLLICPRRPPWACRLGAPVLHDGSKPGMRPTPASGPVVRQAMALEIQSEDHSFMPTGLSWLTHFEKSEPEAQSEAI